MGLFLGLIYGYLWFASIFAGYAAFYCPLFPVVFLSSRLYRCIFDFVLTFWQYYPTALLEFLCHCDVQVTGDAIRTDETSLLVSNHRTRTDWNFLWPAMYYAIEGKRKICHSTKFILKDVIRFIPGPGWTMQLSGYLFVKRNWSIDKETVEKYINFVSNICYKHVLVLFPEGTDLTEKTKRGSDRYAEKNHLKKYQNVLHPRTTGFGYIASRMMADGCLDALYDVTIVYPDVVPQNEKVLFSGGFPKRVKVHLVRYPSSSLPATEASLKLFLENRWSEKEKTIEEFKCTGRFLHGKVLSDKSNKLELYIALVFWSVLPYVVLYVLYVFTLFRHLILIDSLLLVGLNCVGRGFPAFEIGLHNLKTSVLDLFRDRG
ncbi:lysocardiolipin acyltransferase 1-like [Cylas formicarius]|uniref:lysocardiolipin acyltransferase 1-like n=1 Tax=Cylas formicarius TaxID=197179 RepID=UPI0029583733|nr:lysocardiolipin acyltransferase 1-like [Cylas formicarius]